jgi:hypothetical protein
MATKGKEQRTRRTAAVRTEFVEAPATAEINQAPSAILKNMLEEHRKIEGSSRNT